MNKIEAYGSADDIPSVRELRQQIAGFKILLVPVGLLMKKDERIKIKKDIKDVESQLERMVAIIDRFYSLLGPRNWIFHDSINLEATEKVIDTDDPEKAEWRFVEYYQDKKNLNILIRSLNSLPDMRPRLDLIRKAQIDYEEERYYSVALVLISVMDGFVNDFQKNKRKGLHARESDDMVAWDSVVGHHMGLTNVLKSFNKGFHKTRNDEITELYRNGIVHGTLTNFDNAIVATKAWNTLFAVADWAKATVKQEEKEAAEPNDTKSFFDFAREQKEREEHKAKLDQWKEHEEDCSDSNSSDLLEACRSFLRTWELKQYGPLSKFFMRLGKGHDTERKQAGEARELYQDFLLENWGIINCRHTAAAVSLIKVKTKINGIEKEIELRWLKARNDGSSDPVAECVSNAVIMTPF